MQSRLPLWLWLLWAAFIVYGTSIPFNFAMDRSHAARKLGRLTLNPLISDTGRRLSIPDVVQNTMLFVPFGVLGVAALGAKRPLLVRVVFVTTLAATLSTAVEVIQLFSLNRTSSFSDVVVNTCGALMGGIASGTLCGRFTRSVTDARRLGLMDAPAFYPMLVAATLVSVAGWQPFDFTLDVGSIWSKVKALLYDPWQAGVLSDEALQLLRYSMFTLLTARWLRQIGVAGPTGVALIVCGLAGLVVEATQIAIISRLPGLADVSVNLVGVLCGAVLGTAVSRIPSGPWWFVLLVVATWIGAMMQLLSPFTWSLVRHGSFWVPFGDSDYSSTGVLGQIYEVILIGFPLGFALPWVARRRSQIFPAAIGLAIAVIVPIAYLQGWIVGRHSDISTALFAAAGSVAGAWVGLEISRAENRHG